MNWKLGVGVVVLTMVAVLSGCPVKPDDTSCDAGCFGDEFCDSATGICISRADAGVTDSGHVDAGSHDAGIADSGVNDGGADGGPELCTPNEECRPVAGPCDEPETCTSAGVCPVDTFKSGTVVCRIADAGVECDSPEYCSGISAECPADLAAPSGTSCRGLGGRCDVAEECDGVSFHCPPDLKAPPTTSCRGIAGGCDVERAWSSGAG